jgi:predicted nucleotidyltransferase
VTLGEVLAHSDEIRAMASRHGLSNVRVFGSVVRGQADERSDLDLLVDVGAGHGYLDMAGFALDVEDLLGVFTQVATLAGLKSRIRNRVTTEAVAV